MKRSELKRKTPLRAKKSLGDYSKAKGARSGETRVCAAEGCENTFYSYPSYNQRYCSFACGRKSPRLKTSEKHEKARLRRSQETLGTRRGKANPNYRHGKRTDVHSRDRRRFKSGQTECQHPSCPDRSLPICEHHVIYEQAVRRKAGDRFDPRNALALCWSCHSSHHRRGRVLDLRALRDENYVFAVEFLGAAAYDYLRRRYIGDDPRLEAILDRLSA